MVDNSSHDALSSALSWLRLRAAVFGRGPLARDYGVSSAGLPHILFIVVIGGPAHLHISARRAIERTLAPGDTVVLRAGTAFELRAARGCPVVPFERYLKRLQRAQRTAATSVLCGSIELDASGASMLAASLPALIHLKADGGAAARLTAALVEEVEAPRPASALVRMRLAELLFVEAVRECVTVEPSAVRGWLLGLRNPALARSLAALHHAPAQPWTVESLARAAGMSRSTFARLFRATVGTTPLAYLTRLRLQLAARALEAGTESLEHVARSAGYGSDEAFSRAFRAWSGMPPGRYRKSPTT